MCCQETYREGSLFPTKKVQIVISESSEINLKTAKSSGEQKERAMMEGGLSGVECARELSCVQLTVFITDVDGI